MERSVLLSRANADVMSSVCEFLTADEVLHLSLCCRTLRYYCTTQALWEALFHRDATPEAHEFLRSLETGIPIPRVSVPCTSSSKIKRLAEYFVECTTTVDPSGVEMMRFFSPRVIDDSAGDEKDRVKWMSAYSHIAFIFGKAKLAPFVAIRRQGFPELLYICCQMFDRYGVTYAQGLLKHIGSEPPPCFHPLPSDGAQLFAIALNNICRMQCVESEVTRIVSTGAITYIFLAGELGLQFVRSCFLVVRAASGVRSRNIWNLWIERLNTSFHSPLARSLSDGRWVSSATGAPLRSALNPFAGCSLLMAAAASLKVATDWRYSKMSYLLALTSHRPSLIFLDFAEGAFADAVGVAFSQFFASTALKVLARPVSFGLLHPQSSIIVAISSLSFSLIALEGIFGGGIRHSLISWRSIVRALHDMAHFFLHVYWFAVPLCSVPIWKVLFFLIRKLLAFVGGRSVVSQLAPNKFVAGDNVALIGTLCGFIVFSSLRGCLTSFKMQREQLAYYVNKEIGVGSKKKKRTKVEDCGKRTSGKLIREEQVMPMKRLITRGVLNVTVELLLNVGAVAVTVKTRSVFHGMVWRVAAGATIRAVSYVQAYLAHSEGD